MGGTLNSVSNSTTFDSNADSLIFNISSNTNNNFTNDTLYFWLTSNIKSYATASHKFDFNGIINPAIVNFSINPQISLIQNNVFGSQTISLPIPNIVKLQTVGGTFICNGPIEKNQLPILIYTNDCIGLSNNWYRNSGSGFELFSNNPGIEVLPTITTKYFIKCDVNPTVSINSDTIQITVHDLNYPGIVELSPFSNSGFNVGDTITLLGTGCKFISKLCRMGMMEV